MPSAIALTDARSMPLRATSVDAEAADALILLQRTTHYYITASLICRIGRAWRILALPIPIKRVPSEFEERFSAQGQSIDDGIILPRCEFELRAISRFRCPNRRIAVRARAIDGQ